MNFKRQSYLDKIKLSFGKDLIIVLTGQRRIGKSYILRQLKDDLAPENVIYIDKEDRRFDHIATYRDLNTYLDEHLDPTLINYILIDEVQEITEFEKSIRSFAREQNVEVVITGSNARMLSRDLSTIIGGRYKEIYIQALSYREFLDFRALEDNDSSLEQYIQFGGLPGTIRFGNDAESIRDYQSDICNTVLLKDVIIRNSIRNIPFLENLNSFLAENVGKLISASSISKFMKSQNESVTPAAIINYLQYLCDSYMIHRVRRYDLKGKRIFENNEKYYFEDFGIRNALGSSSREGDIEKVIENMVYSKLRALGYEIYVGQLQDKEVDFVCTKPSGVKLYVQVSYLIADDATRKREFGVLQLIRDNHPKYVISATPLVVRNNFEGIIHLGLRQFLLNGLD